MSNKITCSHQARKTYSILYKWQDVPMSSFGHILIGRENNTNLPALSVLLPSLQYNAFLAFNILKECERNVCNTDTYSNLY